MRRILLAVGVAVLLFGTAGAGTVHAATVPMSVDGSTVAIGGFGQGEVLSDRSIDDRAEDDDAEGAGPVGDWWGVGEEAREAPYVGVAEGGVVLLAIGVLGYGLVKRTSILPLQYRRYQLQAHQWIMLVGTGLTLPHFAAVDEWEGVGLAVGILLGIEVVSGLYGRYLHRHVIRLGRGAERSPVVGRALSTTKRALFSRWRQVHVLLTLVTALVLVVHVLTAIGD